MQKLTLKRLPYPLERDEQEAFFAWVKYVKYRGESILEDCYAVPNGSFLHGDVSRRAIQGDALRRQGVTAGVHDINVDIAREPFHGLRIEMKRIGGAGASPAQSACHERRTRRGYKSVVAHGFEQAQAALLEYLGVSDG